MLQEIAVLAQWRKSWECLAVDHPFLFLEMKNRVGKEGMLEFRGGGSDVLSRHCSCCPQHSVLEYNIYL